MTYLTPWPVYTFLATLILLLSVSGLIAVRSYILRRRHQRMIEEAIRNGTYVPPVRPGHVDPSKKPQLWEAYIGSDGGWQTGRSSSFSHGSGKKGLDISTNWKSENSTDWESIKPICAAYTEPLTSVSYSGSTPNLTTSLSPPISIPAPISGPRGDDEENQRTAEVPTGTTTTTTPSLLTRARTFLNPNPASSSAQNETNSQSNSPNISTTELISNSPLPTIRVAVLIAMPSPSSSSSSSHGSSSTPLSTSLSQKPTTSHPLELSPSPTTSVRDEKQQQQQPLLPQLEMGVADVQVVIASGCSSTSDSSSSRRREEKTTSFHSQGSSYAEP